MRKAINRWAFPGTWSLDRVVEAAARHGFEGLELNLEETGDLGLETTEAEAAELGERVRAAGLDIPSVATGLYWTRSLSASDDDERHAGLGVARQQMRVAAAMGVTHVLIVPGAVDVFFLPEKPAVPYEEAYANAQRSLSVLVSEAEAQKIVICVENVWNRFLLSPLEFRRFIDEIDSLLVRAYFDVGNVFQFGMPDDWIRILGSHISRVHVKDYKRSVGTAEGFCDLEDGEIDWAGVMAALREIGYEGWITAELFGSGTSTPDDFLAKTSASLSRILAL